MRIKTSYPVLLQLIIFSQLAIARSDSSSPRERIASGELTGRGEYPFVLSLGLSSWGNFYHLHYCAGIILTENWVITTARCVEDAVDDVGRYYWLAGTNNLRQGGIQHTIREILIHPAYSRNDSLIHDIALVQVRNPFEFSNTIQPVAASSLVSETTPAGENGVVIGWGEVSQTLIQPDVLRSADVTIIDNDLCREVYARWGLTILDEYQFCASSIAANEANALVEDETSYEGLVNRRACRGDEGGPFFRNDVNPPFVAGFVSWTYGCNPLGYPTVYTKISGYLDWIREIINDWV